MHNKALEILLSGRQEKISLDFRLPPRNVPEESRSHKIIFYSPFNGVMMRYSQSETGWVLWTLHKTYDPSGSMKGGEISGLLKLITSTLVRGVSKGTDKAVPLQARCGPEGSRSFSLPDFMTFRT